MFLKYINNCNIWKYIVPNIDDKDKVPIIMFVFCLVRSLDFVYSVYATIEEMRTCTLSKEIIIARANFVLAKG